MKKLMLAAVASLTATAAVAQDLEICVEGAYPPFSETTAAGEVVGFDIDIANALCNEMGMSCEMVKTDWDGIIPALLEDKCDAIIASMSITEERRQVIDFSEKYYQTPAVFVAADGAYADSAAETLSGAVVGVQRGTIHQDFMEGEYPDVELRLYGTQDEAYLDLTAGRVDVLMADSEAMASGFLATEAGEGYSMFGEAFAIPEYHGDGAGIGVRQEDTELRDDFSAAITAIRASGEYDAIAANYFDYNIYGSD
ncbi:transporter substrate-binding domain-containing protein [Pontivivens insulae]|uniref:Lysine/arginine/ornithine-binding periplasmic protein n=1 Tax=Pontivivens insulae TaxID=1639689 RepID=A0A2R8A9H8_9RHOB|nr:transporter substrate-binding domain-containing protein [Pontivivens insulae]RED12810.1 amino acid ABC transporter substrate-binding protein (PAAT family) [Pontivivens insulae]SPF28901.1 Lysine/arginine/ornithine-binding periplasmic protein [Pontivivens insulae]